MTMPMIQDKAFHGDIEKKASDATIFRAGRLSHSRQCLADRFCWASVHLAQAFVTLAYASKSSSLQPGCQRIVQRQQWHLKLDSATHEPAVQVTVTSNEISKKQLATYVPRGSTAKYVPPQLRNVDASCRPDNQALQQEEGRTSSGAKGKYVPPHLRMVDANACLSSQVVQKEGSSFQRTLSDMSIASTDCGTSVISDDATSCFSPSDGCPGLVRFSATSRCTMWRLCQGRLNGGARKKGLVGCTMHLVDENASVCALMASVSAAMQDVPVITADCAVLAGSWPQKLTSAQQRPSVLGVALPAYQPQYQTIGSSMA